jgi:NADPH:quinone reductase-like Zn-dependent oxidoreductase
MRAVVHDRYGPPEVLRVEDVERPEPRDDEVLIRVHATTVARMDTAFLRARPFVPYRLITGIRRPRRRILGSELAGAVAAVGAAVREFAVGDRVFGSTGLAFGAHAEFARVRERGLLAHKPAGLTFEEAAAVCDGALKALVALRQAELRAGQRILVYGASGAIGTAGVQLARHVGAEVTAVCDTRRSDLVASLGADAVIDYTREDFTGNGRTYDVIFDAVGKHSYRRCRDSLELGGTYIATDGLRNAVLTLVTSRLGDRRVLFPVTPAARRDVVHVKELIEAGAYRAVVDRCYPLDEVVEAARYVETEQKTGNVVLTLSDRG